jgi:hypothetical protein
MSSLRRLFVLVLGAATLTVWGAPSAIEADVTGQLSIVLALDHATYSLHEPVLGTLEIHNQASKPVDLDLGKNAKGNIMITITEPSGRTAARTLPELPDGISFPGTVTVGPGGQYQHGLVLNDWDDFAQMGRYVVRVEILRQAGLPSERKLETSTSLEVGTRDPAALRSACQHLADISLNGSGERASAASHALSFAADDACLPALAQVFRASFGQRYLVIRGLARLGTRDALAVVVEGWDGLDKLSRTLVLQAFDAEKRGDALRRALEKAGKAWRTRQP